MNLIDHIIDRLRQSAPPKDHPNAERVEFMFNELTEAIRGLEWTPASMKRFLAKMDSVEEVSGGLLDAGVLCWVLLTTIVTNTEVNRDVVKDLVAELVAERL